MHVIHRPSRTVLAGVGLLSSISLSLWLTPTVIEGQSVPESVVGARVRVELTPQGREVEGWGPPQRIKGIARSVNGDSMTIVLHPSTEPLTVTLDAVEQVDVSRGVGRWRTGFEIGFDVFTTVLCLVVTPWDHDDSDGSWWYSAAGFGVGFAFGAIFPREHWRKVWDR